MLGDGPRRRNAHAHPISEEPCTSPRWTPAITLALVVSACSLPQEPTATPRLVPASFERNGVEVSVNGGGIIDLSGAGAGDAHFAFNASRKADGTVRGQFHERREQGGLVIDFSGTVTCLTVDPVLMRARIGGVVTENLSTVPAFQDENHQVGDDVWFRVADGGEGKGAVDGSTVYGFAPTLVNTAAEYCALPFTGLPYWNPATTFPLKSGNIQIHPERANQSMAGCRRTTRSSTSSSRARLRISWPDAEHASGSQPPAPPTARHARPTGRAARSAG